MNKQTEREMIEFIELVSVLTCSPKNCENLKIKAKQILEEVSDERN